jgi:hypothetical protein
VFVPYNFNTRKEGDNISRLNGIGDIVISGSYNVINNYDSASTLKHSLLIGGGIKLPSGQFRKIENGLTVNQNFQLGTGSVDFLLNAIYTIRQQNIGINTEFVYAINTKNRDDYQFGNTSKAGITAFYVPATAAFTIMPNLGVSLETYKNNKQYGETFPDTGGWAVLYTAGIETYYRSFAFGISYTHPGKQELFNAKVSSNGRLAAHFTIMF